MSRRQNILAIAFAAILTSAGCGGPDDPTAQAGEVAPADVPAFFRYNREYIFVGPREGNPVIAPFTFRSVEAEDELQRQVQAWLARGGTWDRFLDEENTTSVAGGVWRIVPVTDLQIAVGGPAEIETLRFERNERRLRLELQEPITGWAQGADARFRLISGRLVVGSEVVDGPILEMLRVERTLEDGWPPGQDFDWLFLTSGDSIQLVLAETIGAESGEAQYSWARTPAGERMFADADVRWLEVRPYQEARRDIPQRWSFAIPSAGVTGELDAVGFDALLGPERGGRRAVEVRYTVMGWVDLQGERLEVTGMIRHTQQ